MHKKLVLLPEILALAVCAVSCNRNAGPSRVSGTIETDEVHVASRGTGKVVPDAQPAIALTDTSGMSGMAMSEKVNATAMQGIGEGIADRHYGDNVKLTAGHMYKVLVKVKGEKATFTFKA